MPDSNNDLSKEIPEISADAQQDAEYKTISTKIVEGLISIIQDGSAKDLIMSIIKAIKNNPDNIKKFELQAKMADKLYNKLFLFVGFVIVVGAVVLYFDKVIGGQIIFAALGFLGGAGFNSSLRNKE